MSTVRARAAAREGIAPTGFSDGPGGTGSRGVPADPDSADPGVTNGSIGLREQRSVTSLILVGLHHMEHQALTLGAEFFNALNHGGSFLSSKWLMGARKHSVTEDSGISSRCWSASK